MKRNKEVIEAFIYRYPEDCHSGNLHYYARIGKLLSYSTCIAQWSESESNTIIINTTKYSITTSNHRNQTDRMAYNYGISILYTKDNVPMGACDLKEYYE